MTPDLTVSITAARANFEQLVARAERGENVLITRRGRPAAFLMSVSVARRLPEPLVRVSAKDPLP